MLKEIPWLKASDSRQQFDFTGGKNNNKTVLGKDNCVITTEYKYFLMDFRKQLHKPNVYCFIGPVTYGNVVYLSISAQRSRGEGKLHWTQEMTPGVIPIQRIK